METTEAVRDLFTAWISAEQACQFERTSDFNMSARDIMEEAYTIGERLGMSRDDIRELAGSYLVELAESGDDEPELAPCSLCGGDPLTAPPCVNR